MDRYSLIQDSIASQAKIPNKILLIIFDGLGDRPIPFFGYKTPLEYAMTPNLDRIAAKSETGNMDTLGRMVRPASDTAHLAILGYDIEKDYSGRGPIEAAGCGIDLAEGDLAFRCNFATVNRKGMIIDRRANRIEDVAELCKILDGRFFGDGIQLLLKPGTGYRAAFVLRDTKSFGRLTADVGANDPHKDKKSIIPFTNTGTDSNEFTRSILEEIMRTASKELRASNANIGREYPANYLLIRGGGTFHRIKNFKARYGFDTAACIAGGKTYQGVAKLCGMDIIDVPGATGTPESDIGAKAEAAMEILEKTGENEKTFVFLHLKGADSLAEDGNAIGKAKYIEKCDSALSAIADAVEFDDRLAVCVTADHSTASELKAHCADPVPVMFASRTVRKDDVSEFNERACAKGNLGRIEGRNIMPYLMNMIGQLPLIGG